MRRTTSFLESGRPVVVVSHAMPQIKKLCDRVIYLKGGLVTADGPPEEVIEQYLSGMKAEDSDHSGERSRARPKVVGQ